MIIKDAELIAKGTKSDVQRVIRLLLQREKYFKNADLTPKRDLGIWVMTI